MQFQVIADSLRVWWCDEGNISFVGWVDMLVQTERTKKMVEGNVPFLVISQQLNDTIFGFNIIKHQVQSKNDTDSFISLFQMVFDKVGRNKINIFFRIIQ